MNTRSYQLLSYITLALMTGFVLLTFRQYGISNDEEVQHVYGRLLLDFYASGFHDQSAFHYKNLYLYGGLFDVIAAALEKLNLMWVWDMRHLLSALFGITGLIAVYQIANLVGSARTGLIAIILLALTAAWSGAMFTHTKDIPFASCMAWALYYTMHACAQAPSIQRPISIKLGIAIGCALGMRIGAGFAIIYLLLGLALAYLTTYRTSPSLIRFMQVSIRSLLPAAAIAFIIMAVFWPWGVMAPNHPLVAIKAFSNFSFRMLTINHGHVTDIGNVANTYLLNYLWVRLPEVFLMGLLSLLIIIVVQVKHPKSYTLNPRILAAAPIGIAVLFPIMFVLLTKPALYNGVRHFTFILPPLAVLAAIGIDQALNQLSQFKLALSAYLLILACLTALTVPKLVQLHPYQYIFYNVFAGKPADAYQQWEGDYWSSALREAAKTLTTQPLPMQKNPYLVAVCAESFQGSAYLDARFLVTKNWDAADFYLSTTHMHCDQVLKGKQIGQVKRLDTILAVVKDRRQLVGKDRYATPAPN